MCVKNIRANGSPYNVDKVYSLDEVLVRHNGGYI